MTDSPLHKVLSEHSPDEIKQHILNALKLSDAHVSAVQLLFREWTEPSWTEATTDKQTSTRGRRALAAPREKRVNGPVSPETKQLVPPVRMTRTLTLDQFQTSLPLEYILETPILYAAFRKLLKKIYADENLLFLQEISQFQSKYSRMSTEQIDQFVEKIKKRYLLVGADHQINISSANLKSALAKLDVRPLESSVFNDLCKEVKMLLEMDSIPRFVRDPLYEEAKALLREARCISENAFEMASGLSEREWRILTSCASVVELQKGEVLLSERSFTSNLYVLDSGRLSVTQNHKSGNVIELMQLSQPGVVFGELSVVGKLRSFVTITSKENGTKVTVLKASLMVNLLRADTEMAVRFFQQLAKKLAMIFHSQSHVLDYPVGIYRSPGCRSPRSEAASEQQRMEDFLAQHFPALHNSVPIKST